LEIAVLSVGSVYEEILKYICKALQKAFPELTPLLLRGTMPLPREAYNASRDQYHSSILLSRLRPLKLEADKMLGVTEADLYVPSMNFVFGEAHHLWGVAVVSLLRLRPEFYGQTSDNSLFLERCAKEAIHEVGHTLGLSHCDDSGCVMFFSNSIHDTDRKGLSFCGKCYAEVLSALREPKTAYSQGSR
jgi:archaemetzincin